MMDIKTLKETSEECGISVTTAFVWRHKILDALHELTDKVYLAGTVEADETFFNVSYKGNHRKSKRFTMPREAHKRGADVHTSDLSSEKVCVPCMVNDTGISYAKPAKLGKVSSECIVKAFKGRISSDAVLCTDREKAYISFAHANGNRLIQTDTDCRITADHGKTYGIQRINAYHRTLKDFLRGFHGVSTKHLGNYLVWNGVIRNKRRGREDTAGQLFSQILCTRMTVPGSSISARAALPFA
jgi:transposase-like protein